MLIEILKEIEDPPIERCKQHKLIDIYIGNRNMCDNKWSQRVGGNGRIWKK